MNLAQQRRIIVVAGLLTASLYVIAHAQEGLPKARALIGIGGIFTIISIFTDLGSKIGAGMAIVVAISATLTEGAGVINLLEVRSRGTQVSPTLGNKIRKAETPKRIRNTLRQVTGRP